MKDLLWQTKFREKNTYNLLWDLIMLIYKKLCLRKPEMLTYPDEPLKIKLEQLGKMVVFCEKKKKCRETSLNLIWNWSEYMVYMVKLSNYQLFHTRGKSPNFVWYKATALSRIWTWVINSISYDNNHYIKIPSILQSILNGDKPPYLNALL